LVLKRTLKQVLARRGGSHTGGEERRRGRKRDIKTIYVANTSYKKDVTKIDQEGPRIGEGKEILTKKQEKKGTTRKTRKLDAA